MLTGGGDGSEMGRRTTNLHPVSMSTSTCSGVSVHNALTSFIAFIFYNS